MSGVTSKVTDYFFKALTPRKKDASEKLLSGGVVTDEKLESPAYSRNITQEEKIKHLSSVANAVVAYSAKFLSTSLEKLQAEFDQIFSEKQRMNYDRCLLEYCCFKVLSTWTQHEYHLHDNNFHHYTFDCMVAWETPAAIQTEMPATKTNIKGEDYELHAKEQHDEGASLFYTDLIPMLVDVQDTVGMEAFVRIAPCVTLVADSVSARPQFETLTASTSQRLPFALYEKYLNALAKSIKDSKARNDSAFLKTLPLSEDEHVIEFDGVSQTVIEHVGSKSMSGRLTLTDHALYFEPSSVISYKEPVKLNLSANVNHELAPDLSGPWGTRIFDKAIAYKTSALMEPIVFEFPELIGSARRDYWLAIIQEVIDCHRFIKKYGLDEVCLSEALARAVLGIIRLQAMKESIWLLPSKPGALLIFNLAEGFLPWGDLILETLVTTLKTAASSSIIEKGKEPSSATDGSIAVPNSAVRALHLLNLWPLEPSRAPTVVYRIEPGEPTRLEKVVTEASDSSKQTQKAKALEEEVKLEGIGINVAVMNELLKPAIGLLMWLWQLCSWDRPLETVHVLIILAYLIYRDWLGYLLPILLFGAGVCVIWLRISNKMSKYREVVVQTPPGVSLEQVVTAQRAVSQIQGILQAVNVVLLKLWALALSRKAEATNLIILSFLFGGCILALLPFRIMMLVALAAVFTSKFRNKVIEGRLHRRLRDLWHSVPPLPVRVVESEEDKKIQEALQH